jgi:hypothetical protein
MIIIIIISAYYIQIIIWTNDACSITRQVRKNVDTLAGSYQGQNFIQLDNY